MNTTTYPVISAFPTPNRYWLPFPFSKLSPLSCWPQSKLQDRPVSLQCPQKCTNMVHASAVAKRRLAIFLHVPLCLCHLELSRSCWMSSCNGSEGPAFDSRSGSMVMRTTFGNFGENFPLRGSCGDQNILVCCLELEIARWDVVGSLSEARQASLQPRAQGDEHLERCLYWRFRPWSFQWSLFCPCWSMLFTPDIIIPPFYIRFF